MRRKIPSTAALIAFEAAARHESFSRTAEELCLTESAISRQIMGLEHYLGLKLFDRIKGRITLNEAGRSYYQRVRTSLDRLDWETRLLRTRRGFEDCLELAVTPTFAAKWLFPRLKAFSAAHPAIQINVRERPAPFPFRNSGLDAAIHPDHPAWVGVIKIDLFRAELIPVMNPRYYDMTKLRHPADLRHVPLLHKAASSQKDRWASWFEHVGCEHVNSAGSGLYEFDYVLIEAAVAGLGAALVPKVYVADEIARGVLAVPFDHSLKDEVRFCLVYPECNQPCHKLDAFAAWLIAASQQFCAAREQPGAFPQTPVIPRPEMGLLPSCVDDTP